jgi:hypothetical protein
MGRRKKLSWTSISEGLRYFFVGVIGLVAPVDLIPQDTRTWLIVGLSAAIIGLKSIDKGRGIEPKVLKEKPSID